MVIPCNSGWHPHHIPENPQQYCQFTGHGRKSEENRQRRICLYSRKLNTEVCEFVFWCVCDVCNKLLWPQIKSTINMQCLVYLFIMLLFIHGNVSLFICRNATRHINLSKTTHKDTKLIFFKVPSYIDPTSLWKWTKILTWLWVSLLTQLKDFKGQKYTVGSIWNNKIHYYSKKYIDLTTM